MDFSVPAVSVRTVTFQFGGAFVYAQWVLLVAVSESVDLFLCWVPYLISLDIGEVVTTVAIVKTAQTDEFVIFGIHVTVRDLDNDVLNTVPENIDAVLGLDQNIASTLWDKEQNKFNTLPQKSNKQRKLTKFFFKFLLTES